MKFNFFILTLFIYSLKSIFRCINKEFFRKARPHKGLRGGYLLYVDEVNPRRTPHFGKRPFLGIEKLFCDMFESYSQQLRHMRIIQRIIDHLAFPTAFHQRQVFEAT